MKIQNDINYIEGHGVGTSLVDVIAKTIWGNLKAAYLTKQTVIDNFEKEFNYSSEAESFDRNYSYTYGMRDALKEALDKSSEAV